ncbi:MAG TPA: PAS domain S-box protein [Methanotrichaceae archaeon]|nr:PAS domain S-box protein [Methanotrichaceae archaeon]
MIDSISGARKSDETSTVDAALIDSLKESECRYSSFFNSSPDGFVLINEKGAIIEWNQRMEQLTGLTMSDVTGRSLWDIHIMIASHSEGQEATLTPEKRREIECLFNKGPASWPDDYRSEMTLPGRNKAIQVVIFPIKSEKGIMFGVLARDEACSKPRAADMSKSTADLNQVPEEVLSYQEMIGSKAGGHSAPLRKNGSKLRNKGKAVPGGVPFGSLNDKAMNSLQKLPGMPSSPSADSDGSIEEELELGRNRIKSIALAYDLLSKSTLLDRISIAVYISGLVEMVTKSCRVRSDRISFVLDVDDVMLRPESIVSCGLIINEIVSNSLIYASPDGEKWMIRIEFRSMGASIYRLAISDNGKEVGLDDEGTPLRIALNSLIKEIEGRIKIDVSKGNRAEIYFNELKYDSRLKYGSG